MSLYKSHYLASRVLPPLFALFVRSYVRLRVEGVQHIPRDGGFLLVANHNSHADTAVIFTALPQRMRGRVVAAAARDYFFKGGTMQFLSRTLFNAIPIERDTKRGHDPMRHVIRALREGYGVVFFPEGTRSKDGTLGPFRGGVGRLLAEFPNLPVVPTWVEGATRVMPKGKLVPRPRKMVVRFGEPLHLHPHLHDRASWQEAANQIREAVVQLSGLAPAGNEN